MKNKSKYLFFLIIFLCISFRIGYICFTIPDEIYVREDTQYSFDKYGFFSPLFSMNVSAQKGGVLGEDGKIEQDGNSYSANVKFLDFFTLKSVNVNLVDKSYVVPGGDVLGIKIYAEGVEILKISEFENQQGVMLSPCKNLSLKKGDVIKQVNGKNTKTIYEFTQEIQKAKGEGVNLTVQGDKGSYNVTVTPQPDTNGVYKTGLLVRDSMAGIGTLTYYCPSDNTFAALGHAIEDADTGKIFPMENGTIEEAKVISVEKGRRGMPGELHGMFTSKSADGEIVKNCPTGIFGKSETYSKSYENAIPTATISQTKEGKAQILCTIDGEGVKEFDIEIERIIFMNSDNSKGMIIHITDSELLNATGGIVQGMSGSPIVQDGKLVGAVTHVFVNDPTRGYGIFIENMLSEAEKIK